MLQSLRAKGFKSWKDTGPLTLAPITGFFGTNSSGKTGILQLLLMLKQTAESSDLGQVLNLGDERSLIELGTFRDVVLEHDPEAGLHLEFKWGLPKALAIQDPEGPKGTDLFRDDTIEFATDIAQNEGARLHVDNFTYRFAGTEFGMRRKAKGKRAYSLFPASPAGKARFRFKRTQGRPWELPPPTKCYGFPDQVRAYYQNAGFVSDLELQFEQLWSRLYYLGPLREYPKRQYPWAGAQPADMGRSGEKVIDAILASRDRGEKISRGAGRKRLTLEEYVAHWLRELRLIHEFSVEPVTEESNLFRVKVRTTPKAPEVLVTDVGFGVSQILPVIAICYYVPEGSTIVLEQPEIHLHPSVQAGLADVFVDAARVRNVQIIVESHSEHLLRRLQRRIAEEVVSNEDVSLYFCESKGGLSKISALHLDLFGNITNWPEGFFGDEFGEMAAMTRAAMRRKKRGQG